MSEKRFLRLLEEYGEDLDLWKNHIKCAYEFKLDFCYTQRLQEGSTEPRPYVWDATLINASDDDYDDYWPNDYADGQTPDEAIQDLLDTCAKAGLEYAKKLRDWETQKAKEIAELARKRSEQLEIDAKRTLVVSQSEFQEILRSGRKYDSNVQIVKVVEDETGKEVMSIAIQIEEKA